MFEHANGISITGLVQLCLTSQGRKREEVTTVMLLAFKNEPLFSEVRFRTRAVSWVKV